MTRIRCRERRCTFNKNGICTSDEIEYEPDAGCLTMEAREAVADAEEEWEDEEDPDADLDEEAEEKEDEADEDDEWEENRGSEDEYLGARRRKR